MGSTRLPGKVMMPIAGKPMLGHVIDRLQACRQLNGIVVATTELAADMAIVNYCQQRGIQSFCGPERDVLKRYRAAAEREHADLVVRITADCPLTDPALVAEVVALMVDKKQRPDFASNALEPATYPLGTAVEVMTMDALRIADERAVAAAEREHVTPCFYKNTELFRIAKSCGRKDLSWHRWTVDTPADFELVSRILKSLGEGVSSYSIGKVLSLFERNPDWLRINQHIVQKSACDHQSGQ